MNVGAFSVRVSKGSLCDRTICLPSTSYPEKRARTSTTRGAPVSFPGARRRSSVGDDGGILSTGRAPVFLPGTRRRALSGSVRRRARDLAVEGGIATK
ncbi:MAG: hypothetical protein BJ554DRAFT_1279 [Olpidium bornovanus]|uniref:Uncharacterized protein n=1 Tax=Olpidium bornovanus TaxID=278681 RepID=A0A8H8DH85_9FUNG|nr:MAG: hypothetical protein BJ554DRAFT_1279 [Olpidium bornovanus]